MNSCNCIEYNTEHGALFTFTYNLCTLYVYISMYSYLKKNIRKSAMESATAAQNPTNQRSHTNERKNDDDLAMMKKKKKKTQNNTYIS